MWEEDPEVRLKPALAKASGDRLALVQVGRQYLVYWPPQDKPTRGSVVRRALKAVQAQELNLEQVISGVGQPKVPGGSIVRRA